MSAARTLAWPERLTLWLYGGLTRALQPWVRRRLARRARHEPLYGEHIPERFGHYTGHRPEHGCVWVHAVSLGETRAAALLLPALRAAWPGMRLLLTHGTATGREQGRSLLQPGDLQVWAPWDSPEAVARFLAHHRPRIGLILETEVWPQWVEACARQQLPLVLLNARLNARTQARAQRLAWLSRPAYGRLWRVLAQSPQDAERLHTLGCRDVQITGNLKFDVRLDPAHAAVARRWQAGWGTRPVIMFASSREGEEAQWLAAWLAQREHWPSDGAQRPLWLLVPRHPQRFDEVHVLLQAAGLKVIRRSAWGQAGPGAQDCAEADVILGDSLGEMPVYYQASRLALMGGSFAPLGGQNLIEAMACACPVILGPSVYNFAEAAEWALQAGAAVQVSDLPAALQQARVWLEPGEALAGRAQAGLDLIARQQGAVQATVQGLADWAPKD